MTTVNKFITNKGYALESQTVQFNMPVLNYKRPGSAFKIIVSTKNGKAQTMFWREEVNKISFFIQEALGHGFESRGGVLINDEKQVSIITNLDQLDNGLVIVGALNKKNN